MQHILQYDARLADEEKGRKKERIKIPITTINITAADCDRLYKLLCMYF